MSDANAPATREDFETLSADIRGLNRMLSTLLTAIPAGGASAAGGNFNVNFGTGGLALWASVTCAIVTTIVSLILVVLFSTAFLFFASQENWAAQEVTAIRSYITNGKLKPMAPRPGFSESITQDPHPEKSP